MPMRRSWAATRGSARIRSSGGNVWLLESVPANSIAYFKADDLSSGPRQKKEALVGYVEDWVILGVGPAPLAVGHARASVGREEGPAVDHPGVDLHQGRAGIELLGGAPRHR